MIERTRIEAVLGRIGSLLQADGSDVKLVEMRKDRVMTTDGSVVTRFTTLLRVSLKGSERGTKEFSDACPNNPPDRTRYITST